MFDSKLFYDLCEKYGVELSDKYSEPMIKVNGEIIPLREYDFEEKCEKLKEKQINGSRIRCKTRFSKNEMR